MENLAERVTHTTELLRLACERLGIYLTADDRVPETGAAQLLDYTAESFRNLRIEEIGPPFYNMKAGPSRVSYRLQDLAHWIESRKSP